MKLSQAIRLFLCFYSIIWTFDLKSLGHDQLLLNMYTAQDIIKNISKDIQDYQIQEQEENKEYDVGEQDFIIDIIVILVETYEKIVGATVTYCLMMHNPILQQNLHDQVAKIIAQNIVKIFAILSKQFVYLIFNKKMSLQEKLWHCGCIVSIIILIKLGIDQIPQAIKPEKNNENFIFPKDESGYVSDKFAHYR